MVGGGGGGEGAGGGTNYVSVSRDRSDFQSLYGTVVYSIVQILGRSSNISVWKGIPPCLESKFINLTPLAHNCCHLKAKSG